MEYLKPSEGVIERVISRIRNEYQAHYHYVNLSNWCDVKGWPNAAKFFRDEAAAEIEHAKKLMAWLADWNIMFDVTTPEAEVPAINSLSDCINVSYAIEANLWKYYNEDAIAVMAEDVSAYDLLREMVKIQTESVAEYRSLMDRYSNCSGDDFLFESVAFK